MPHQMLMSQPSAKKNTDSAPLEFTKTDTRICQLKVLTNMFPGCSKDGSVFSDGEIPPTMSNRHTFATDEFDFLVALMAAHRSKSELA